MKQQFTSGPQEACGSNAELSTLSGHCRRGYCQKEFCKTTKHTTGIVEVRTLIRIKLGKLARNERTYTTYSGRFSKSNNIITGSEKTGLYSANFSYIFLILPAKSLLV